MPITQCERCKFDYQSAGRMNCTNEELSLEYIFEVQQNGVRCRKHENIDSTDTGEPWHEIGGMKDGYPF